MSDSAPAAPVVAAAPKEQKQQAKKEPKKKAGPAGAVNLSDLQTPEFWESRGALFDELFKEQVAAYAAKSAPITITLPDGKQIEASSWVTTPLDIARKLSNSLPDKVIVAKVDDKLWDASRPLEENCSIELLTWEDKEAQEVFWHSSAHVLGYALERVFKCKLSVGPALAEGGFFYEGDTDRPVTEADYPTINAAMAELVKAKSPYQRLCVTKDQALKLFGYSEFKSKILVNKVPEGSICTVYKCGNMIDPCRGPHLPDTGRVKAYAVTKNSSSYFEGNAENAVLQRVYGISFPQEKLLKEWKEIQEEAAKRDHRVIGRQQELFGFHEVSPGSAFWLPHGTRIYNGLIEFVRKQYRKRGFVEVISPNIFNSKLWMVSGHWQHYKDAMFRTECEHEEYALKPMNCPGHCLLFGLRPRSYKELPIRMAEFGVLHRNELSGALTGLTRVRRFQQDDAHIFCTLDQVESEIVAALDFLSMVYGVFGFKFHLNLSTRPENALGTKEIWDVAEENLRNALNSYCGIPEQVPDAAREGETFEYNGTPACMKRLKASIRKQEKEAGYKPSDRSPWELNAGDGAFYGPKIDIQVEDALRRRHQCATIQLDFNLPERFGLKYTLPGNTGGDAKPAAEAKPVVLTEVPVPDCPCPAKHVDPADAKEEKKDKEATKMMHVDRSLDSNQARPVMIHRAIFGSLERCIAILCEHFGGKWPFWLSPRQVVVIPVSKAAEDYARTVSETIYGAGFFCEVDDSAGTLERKIRNSQLAQYNFILVCGEKEVADNQVDVRTRNQERHGAKSVPEVIEWLEKLSSTYSQEY